MVGNAPAIPLLYGVPAYHSLHHNSELALVQCECLTVLPANKLSLQELNQLIGIKLLS